MTIVVHLPGLLIAPAVPVDASFFKTIETRQRDCNRSHISYDGIETVEGTSQ